MSTIKADAVTAVSTNADLSLDGLGTGGVSIASTLKMTKGGDIPSASPLVIDIDGNYFDVTGTTSFSAMTVEAGNFFMLQFDGALTITHGSGIELPGAANLTTATGDRLICYATAANTVEVMSVETEAAASAGFTLGTEQSPTSGTDANFTGIPAGTKQILMTFKALKGNTGGEMYVELGDSGGLETSGYLSNRITIYNTTNNDSYHKTTAFHTGQLTSAEGLCGFIHFVLQDSSENTWVMDGQIIQEDSSTKFFFFSAGIKSLSGELTQINLTHNIANFTAGSINIQYSG